MLLLLFEVRSQSTALTTGWIQLRIKSVKNQNQINDFKLNQNQVPFLFLNSGIETQIKIDDSKSVPNQLKM